MSVLFLLLVAVAILLMSHRYWGRMLGAFVFAPLSTPPAKAPAAGTALQIAASGGVLSLVGTGLALAWGWAPVYVWILLACAFGAGLMAAAFHWLASVTGEATGLHAIDRVGGSALAGAMRLALSATLIVWLPVTVVMLVSLLGNHPAAVTSLMLQFVLALVLRRWLGDAVGTAGAGVVLVAGIAAVPAGIAMAQALPGAITTFAASGTATAVAAGLAILVAAALARVPRARFLEPLSVLVAVALAALVLLAIAAVAIEHPAAGYLGYHRAGDYPGALPLVAACASVGVLPLLCAVVPDASRDAGETTMAGATFEGLVASVLFAALLAAPVLMGDAPVALPDWIAGIEPGAVTAYAVASLAALGARLPVSPPIVADAVAAVLASLLAVMLVVGTGALQQLLADLAHGPVRRRGTANAAAVVALAMVAGLTLWRGALPVDAWLAAGQLALLFCAALTAAAAFTAVRLRRGGRTAGACAAVLGVLFWWSCLQQLVLAADGGDWWTLSLQVMVAGLGLFCTAALAGAFARLAAARQAA